MKSFRISYQLPSGETRELELSPRELRDRLLPSPVNLMATTLIIDALTPNGGAVRIWLPTADGFDADVQVSAGPLPPVRPPV